MSSEEIFDKVKEIIVEQLGVAETAVAPEASFIDDLGADSLDIVELIMAIEEEFDLEIPDSDAEKVVTVSDVVDYIKDNVSIYAQISSESRIIVNGPSLISEIFISAPNIPCSTIGICFSHSDMIYSYN